MRVLAAMSGGVDSAVAAARAVDAGHDVVGVHLALSRGSAGDGAASPAPARARGCCTVEDAGDARRAADVLGIPFYVWDLSERFQADVVDDFTAEYAAGRTPNPCVRCNERVKFAALLDRALALGFDALATGHYARLEPSADGGPPTLHRARDAAKDQSYVLAVLPPERLARALLPLGDAASKAEVREEAAQRGLAVAEKPDSHDICFVPGGDARAWLAERVPRRPGLVRDEDGAVLGEHDGAAGFTVGQRRGLRVGRPAADGKPRYVLSLSVASGDVVVGPAERLERTRVVGGPPVWAGPPPAAGHRLGAQLRAHGAEVPCVLAGTDPLVVDLAEPVRGVAPGQTVALYDGTRVVGSATVERAA
ncbi:tRNA 2-thiouridine(34) synthase MnmA [uncultured Pseudokineococcus sp.]|uniref:tRNA 2-thiouridine(34) synthase MnmA n=1 Tax=uncultured Pseudokineococcus sp. TaxID=1642928 RepID=UPI00263A13B5|nr:tRNA 2-thiouridine(34) synthase MnmA [uncultured Pseudokineococcus sp.]